MDFLFYKDILFEISKYLSYTDLKHLKFAFSNLDLENLAKEKLIEWPTKIIHYPPLIFSHLIEVIVNNNAHQFLFYNFRIKNGITIFDVNYRELNRIGFVSLINETKISDIHIFNQELFMIGNCSDWKNFLIEKSFDHSQFILTDKYIRYLIKQNRLDKFIIDNSKKLNKLKYYIQKKKNGRLIMSKGYTYLLWMRLSRDDKLALKKQLAKFIKTKTFDNLFLDVKLFLTATMNKLFLN